ncbi:MAG: sugar ABC transporter permease [Oscillospiraceae bacterium]|nr:sugar ABC transporter permease [Oscillospiraceae bacterium]
MRVKRVWVPLFLLPTLVIFAAIYVIPIFTVLVTSFFNYTSKAFNFNGIQNYLELFSGSLRGRTFSKAFQNTIIWVLLQSVFHVALGATVGLMLSRKPRGWKFVRTAYMIPNIISTAALGMVYLNVFDPERGFLNSIIRIFIPDYGANWYVEKAFMTTTYTWLMFAGLVTILVLADIMSISDDIFEAARVDGATGLMIDFYITLPLLKNVLGTCVILAATSMLKEFELIYMTTNGGPGITTMNLPIMIYKLALTEQNYGMANAIGTITILLGIAIIALINRLFNMGNTDR